MLKFNRPIFLRMLSVLILPLLACALVPVGFRVPTSPPSTPAISTTQLPKQTSAALTRVAKKTLTFSTPTPTPPTLPSNTPALAPSSLETPTASPTVSLNMLLLNVNKENIPAPSLADNLLGESAERELLVYLPSSYYQSQKHYPVVYYLLDFGAIEAPAGIRPKDIQKDIRAGYAKEMILVIVSGVNTLGGSFYVNSPVTGGWEDFITRDLVAYVDAHYRTIPNAASRGIGGDSMGGFGALNLAMLHPDVFSAVYSIRPYLFDQDGLAESPMFTAPRAVSAFVDLMAHELLLPVDEAISDMQHTSGDVQFALAYGAAFVPDPQAGPPYLDYPYYRQNGRLFRDDATWGRWGAGFGNIPDKIQAYKENLLKLKSIAVDYGTDDPYRWVPRGCEYFSAQLTAAGIPNRLVAFSGDPQASLEQRIREYMLPFFSETLAFDD